MKPLTPDHSTSFPTCWRCAFGTLRIILYNIICSRWTSLKVVSRVELLSRANLIPHLTAIIESKPKFLILYRFSPISYREPTDDAPFTTLRVFCIWSAPVGLPWKFFLGWLLSRDLHGAFRLILFLPLYDVTCQSFAAPSNWTFHSTFFSARNPPHSYWLCAFISSLSIFRILCSIGTRWGNSHGLALIFWGNLNTYSDTSFSHDPKQTKFGLLPACSHTYVDVPCPLATRDMTGENSVRQQKKLLYPPPEKLEALLVLRPKGWCEFLPWCWEIRYPIRLESPACVGLSRIGALLEGLWGPYLPLLGPLLWWPSTLLICR